MKVLNKISKLLLILSALIITASCAKEVAEREQKMYEKAEIISYGFYQVDNPGKITRDYIFSNLKQGSVVLQLPAEVEKEALIARFTITQGATLTLNGVPQISGVTVNNYTIPNDFIVSNRGNNIRFTMTIDKAPDYVFTRTTPFISDQIIDVVMKLNPITGNPSIAYKVDRVETTVEKLAMAELVNGEWKVLGDANGFTEGRVTNHDLIYDSQGSPYVVYADYTATVAQGASVMTYKNGSWSYTGTKGITPFVASYNVISLIDEKPIIFSMNNSTGADKRAMIYSTFDGSVWTTNQKITGRAAPGGVPMGTNSYYPVVKKFNNDLYLYIFNAGGTQSFSIYKYSGGVWSTIVEQYIDAGATTSYMTQNDMEIDKHGNIYVTSVDNATGSYRMKVKKYDVATSTWSTFGDLISTSQYSRATDLSISPLGTIYLAYHNDLKQPVVTYYDKETRNWTTPIILDNAESSDIYLEFMQNGTGYAGYLNSSKNFVMFKYDTPQN